MMKPMLLTEGEQIPIGDSWAYEMKYDGFRALLIWDSQQVKLISRNNNELTLLFPEIIDFSKRIYKQIKNHLPMIFDGEIVHLKNFYKSDFPAVQRRSKLRLSKQIEKLSKQFPCQYIAFDLLQYKGEDISGFTLTERKERLHKVFKEIQNSINALLQPIQEIKVFANANEIWDLVTNHNGEGVVAKKKDSRYISGIRSKEWIKIKNWRTVTVILTKYNEVNGYFHGSVYDNQNNLKEIVTFRHGLSKEQEKTLTAFFKENGSKLNSNMLEMPPSICIDVQCIDFAGGKLREPKFSKFRFDLSPEDVTWRKMLRQLHPLPNKIQITHPDKPIWPKLGIIKDDFLYYLQCVSPYILPFLRNRLLTAIRYPHGLLNNEHFYQKNAPEYKPDFISTKKADDIEYILCNDIESLIWLGNQMTIEFHIPFQTADTHCPTEIVFDLDPPSRDEFSLAIEAALRIKEILEGFKIQSFIKTSGNKGLQVYIPLRKNSFSYEDTRIFTEFVCLYLCEQEPKWFTVERLKKNRDNKLYLDYVQHGEGKTIIAPYSPRANENALVAAPLYWNEVNSKLHPSHFTISTVLERMQKIGNPFQHFFETVADDNLRTVIDHLKSMKDI